MNKSILTIDGMFLVVMGTLAGITDLSSYFLGIGPFGDTYFENSIAIGGFEAHCLAVIAGLVLVLKSRSSDAQFFNKVAIAIHIVLGSCNLLWFRIFFDTGMVAMGFITTVAHFAFVFLNTIAVSKKRTSGVVVNNL